MSNRRVKKIVHRYAESLKYLPNDCQRRGFSGRQYRALMARARFYAVLRLSDGLQLLHVCELAGARVSGTV